MPKTPTTRQIEKMMVTLVKMQERADRLANVWTAQMGYKPGDVDSLPDSQAAKVLEELESVSCSLEMALQELDEMLGGGWV